MRRLAAPRTVNETEGDDLLRAQGGDRNAFASLVGQHQRLVYGLARRIVYDPGAAEEVAQDVFVQLHRHLATIDSPAHLVAWLRRVATHRAIDAARRRHLRRDVSLEAMAEPTSVQEEKDPWVSRLLRRLVAGLPAGARAVVVLRYQQDLEPGEIAAVLDMPVNTVKSHLRRSLMLLRSRAEKMLEAGR